MDISEIDGHFVASFPHSTTRKTILDGYQNHSKDLLAVLGECEEYLDGSFVTSKNDPGDIDFVVLADPDKIDALAPDKKLKLKALVSGPLTKTAYSCDAYFCPVYPVGHALHDMARQQRKYWLGEFGYDRLDVPKGIVHVTLSSAKTTAT
ncbi:hypothetical protein LRC39_09550 [Rhodopseudomonas sp. P1]